jgi:hypothetical protein
VTEQSYWVEERPPYYVQTGAAFENPYGMPRAEIERYIKNHTAENVAQVIYGKYVDNSGLVFTGELVAQMFDREGDTVRDERFFDVPRWRQGRIDAVTKPSMYRYAGGGDLARKKDHTVITVLDTVGARVGRPARVVYWRRLNRVPWTQIYAAFGRAMWLFPGQWLIDETGGQGDVVMDELESRWYCPYHHVVFEISGDQCPNHGRPPSDENRKLLPEGFTCDSRHWQRMTPDGYTFSTNSKVDLVNHLQSCLGRGYDEDDPEKEFGIIRSPRIIPIQEEMGEYAWDDKKLSTDCVFSLALAAWAGLEDVPFAPAEGSIYGD